MKTFLSGGLCAAVAGAAMLLSLGANPAQAQVPGGSYLQTCTNVHATGNRVVATCRRTDGSWRRTALHDVRSCVGGLANANGRLVCGRGEHHHARSRDGRDRHYGSSRDHRWRDHGRHYDRRWQGYGSSYWPGYNYGGHYWYGR